jgi:hypothetical protein
MGFMARVDKPCTFCNVVIPKGTASGFTWDRAKGGFIHSECMRQRKAQGGAQSAHYCPQSGCTTLVSEAGMKCAAHVPTMPEVISGSIPAVAIDPAFNDYTRPHKHGRDGLPVPPEVCNFCLTHKDVGHKPGCGRADAETVVTRAKRAADNLNEPVARELARLIQSLAGQRGIDESEVRRIAADEASKVSSNRAISITVGAAPEIKLDLAHRDIPLLIKLISAYGANGHRQNIYMHGPAGSGKSTAARQSSKVLDLPYGYISLNPQTPDSRLLGYMHAGGEYVKSEFFERYTKGGVFCIDEIDNAAASLVTTLNGLLENGHGAFPHGVFERHKDFVCVCTANTIGRGGDVNYPERRALDGAFLERFIFLSWEYDNDLTKAIVSGVLGTAAPEFMAWVASEARTLQARFPTLIVSPRAYIQGAVLEKLGLSRNQIIPMVISRGL